MYAVYAARMASVDAVLDTLRAVGEETRLRIVALLRHAELTVTDLTEILGQSQPRVSRHLKLLVDAGVVDKHREGTWAFFRLVDDGSGLSILDGALAALDTTDPVMIADRDRLASVRERRATAAHEYFDQIAPIWDEERSMHAAEDAVEAAIVEAVGTGSVGRLVDLGTGTGRILQLLGPDPTRAVGIDSSHSMLSVARANLERSGASPLRTASGRRVQPAGRCCQLRPRRRSIRCCTTSTIRHGRSRRRRASSPPAADCSSSTSHPTATSSCATRRPIAVSASTTSRSATGSRSAGLDCSHIRDLAPPSGDDGLTVTVWLATEQSALKGVA